jgi:hypothetical protein
LYTISKINKVHCITTNASSATSTRISLRKLFTMGGCPVGGGNMLVPKPLMQELPSLPPYKYALTSKMAAI